MNQWNDKTWLPARDLLLLFMLVILFWYSRILLHRYICRDASSGYFTCDNIASRVSSPFTLISYWPKISTPRRLRRLTKRWWTSSMECACWDRPCKMQDSSIYRVCRPLGTWKLGGVSFSEGHRSANIGSQRRSRRWASTIRAYDPHPFPQTSYMHSGCPSVRRQSKSLPSLSSRLLCRYQWIIIFKILWLWCTTTLRLGWRSVGEASIAPAGGGYVIHGSWAPWKTA